MLKTAYCVCLLSFCSVLGFATGTALLLPPHVADGEGEIAEGLALALAAHDQLADKNLLIPFTAVRKKLEAMNLPITGPVTLASQFRIAEYLGGYKILKLEQGQQKATLTTYDVTARFLLSRYSLEAGEADFEKLVRMMADDLSANAIEMDEARVAYYRVWASAYLAPDQQAMQEIMDRLLQTPFANWLLIQEYIDLFGDPAAVQEDVDSQAYWRDFYFERHFYQGALTRSVNVLELRHNPADLIAQARILIALGDDLAACDFLKQADSFGFDLGDLRARFETCNFNP